MSRFDRFAKLLRRPNSRGRVASAAPAPWTPLDLSPTALFDAADLTAGAITGWADASGNGNDLDAGTATAVATGFNGGSEPYVQFNGSSDHLRRASFTWGGSLTAVTYAMVYVLDAATNGGTVLRYGGTGARPTFLQTTLFRPLFNCFSATSQTPASNALQSPRVVTGRSTRLSTQKYHIPGTVEPADIAAGSDTHADGNYFIIGAANPGTSGWSQMKVAMCWVINRYISDAEYAEWLAYAGARWGVPTS